MITPGGPGDASTSQPVARKLIRIGNWQNNCALNCFTHHLIYLLATESNNAIFSSHAFTNFCNKFKDYYKLKHNIDQYYLADIAGHFSNVNDREIIFAPILRLMMADIVKTNDVLMVALMSANFEAVKNNGGDDTKVKFADLHRDFTAGKNLQDLTEQDFESYWGTTGKEKFLNALASLPMALMIGEEISVMAEYFGIKIAINPTTNDGLTRSTLVLSNPYKDNNGNALGNNDFDNDSMTAEHWTMAAPWLEEEAQKHNIEQLHGQENAVFSEYYTMRTNVKAFDDDIIGYYNKCKNSIADENLKQYFSLSDNAVIIVYSREDAHLKRGRIRKKINALREGKDTHNTLDAVQAFSAVISDGDIMAGDNVQNITVLFAAAWRDLQVKDEKKQILDNVENHSKVVGGVLNEYLRYPNQRISINLNQQSNIFGRLLSNLRYYFVKSYDLLKWLVNYIFYSSYESVGGIVDKKVKDNQDSVVMNRENPISPRVDAPFSSHENVDDIRDAKEELNVYLGKINAKIHSISTRDDEPPIPLKQEFILQDQNKVRKILYKVNLLWKNKSSSAKKELENLYNEINDTAQQVLNNKLPKKVESNVLYAGWQVIDSLFKKNSLKFQDDTKKEDGGNPVKIRRPR